MKTLGKTLQVVALVILPLSMLLELTGVLGRSFGVSEMLIMLVFGGCAFIVGRLLEGYAET